MPRASPIQPNGHLVKKTKPSPKVRPPSPSSRSCKRQSPSLLLHQLAVLLRAFEETNLAKDRVYICCTEILSEARMEKEVQQNAFSDEEQRIYEIIARDDGDEFQSALEGAVIGQYFGYIVKLQFGESEFCPFELLHWICYHRAARCGALLLERNDGLVIDLNVAKRDGIFPLHEAACSLSSSLVKLFLRHGAEANRRLDAIDSDKRELLPVQIALETLSCDNTLTEWKPNTKESVFDLIIMLCFPRLQDQLETVRLLVAHTELLDEIVCYYVLKGALVELAILLMANWEKVMGPVSCLCVDGSKVQVPLRYFIRSEMAALLDLEYYLMHRKGEEEKKLYELSKERKSAMLSTLPLLEVFEKAGDAIGKYVQSRDVNIQDEQVAEDVTRLFREAGFRPNSQGNRLVTMKSAKDAILEEQTESIEEKKDDLGIESRGETPLNPLFPKEDTSTRTDIDFGGNTFDLELLKMTPLITALEKLSTYKRLRQWTPQQSIFKLIIMLCLPEMKQVLETARLLELNQKDISEAACYFAMKGKIIELAILLMVAREKALGPVCAYGFENHSSSETAITFRQFVRRELAGLLDLGFCLMGRKDPELVRLDDLCEEREQAMLPTLPLLDVFERAGAAIEVYLQSRPDGVVEEQVVQDMERLFADAGYKLKSEDINLSSTAHSASDKVLLDQQDHSVQVSKDNHVERTEGVSKINCTMPPYSQLGGSPDIYSMLGLNNHLQRFIFAQNRWRPSAFSSNIQHFHTCSTKASLSFGLAKPWEVRQHKIAQAEQNMQKVSTKWLSAFVLLVKRGLKCL